MVVDKNKNKNKKSWKELAAESKTTSGQLTSLSMSYLHTLDFMFTVLHFSTIIYWSMEMLFWQITADCDSTIMPAPSISNHHPLLHCHPFSWILFLLYCTSWVIQYNHRRPTFKNVAHLSAGVETGEIRIWRCTRDVPTVFTHSCLWFIIVLSCAVGWSRRQVWTEPLFWQFCFPAGWHCFIWLMSCYLGLLLSLTTGIFLLVFIF